MFVKCCCAAMNMVCCVKETVDMGPSVIFAGFVVYNEAIKPDQSMVESVQKIQ